MPVDRPTGHGVPGRTDRTRRVAVGDLSFAVDQQGDGPAVLFVHGFPLDRTMWRHTITPLTGRHRIAPDLRGLGLSDVPEAGYSISGYADDMVALLDALGVAKAVACGFSMGGYVALDVVRRYRERLSGLILVNTRANADQEDAKRARDDMIQLVRERGTVALAEALLPKLLAPLSLTALPQVVEQVRATIVGSPVDGVIGALMAMKERRDATRELADIDLPTLVIAGREDQLISVDDARTMADQIPQAQFTVIAEAGHLVPMEQSLAASRVIGEFLEALD
jgi:pimeloyl-ACP methyl ester carboxylesterase